MKTERRLGDVTGRIEGQGGGEVRGQKNLLKYFVLKCCNNI